MISYGSAWIGHFVFEHNKPAAFKNPFYSLAGDFRMVFEVFTGLAIFIACLGLFGLATFNTLQRVKEIGVRKVMGASVANILTLLSREIVILIAVANIVAWPIAWFVMSLWLSSFAYHIDMNALVYLASAVLAILIALITVSVQTIKAAMTNPSNTLRYE